MKNYKYRGLDYLIPYLCAVIFLFIISIIRYCRGGIELSRLIGMMIAGSLGGGSLLYHFVRVRRMTEEQFEAEQKKLRMGSDERAMAIREKAALKSLGITSLLGLLTGFVFFVFDVFTVAFTCFAFSGGMWIVDIIAVAVLNKKM